MMNFAVLEVFVTVFLTMELFLEMVVAVSNKRHMVYAMNPWHWVDYLVLTVSWMFLLDPENKFTAVCRALRVVRPMRSVRIFSSIKLIGDCLKEDLGIFLDVTTFTLLLILTFSLVGLTCYHGALQYTCGVPVNPNCPGELSGMCSDNSTWIGDAGQIVQLRVPRESWAQESSVPEDRPTMVSMEGPTTQRLVAEGYLAMHVAEDTASTSKTAYLLTGFVDVELPTLAQLKDVYGDAAVDKLPQDGSDLY